MRTLALAMLVALGVAGPGPAWGLPEELGPLPVAVWDAGPIVLAGAAIPVRAYQPEGEAAPRPVVVVMHGWLRTGAFHVETARALASRGLVALLDWASDEGQRAGSPLEGRVDAARRGLIGHSYGGLAVYLATSRDPRIQVVVGFDPKDDLATVRAVAGDIRVPNAHLMAQTRGLCNDDWGDAVFPLTAAPKLRFVVDRSGHCDPEEPSDALCPLACGAGDHATSPLFRRYAVAFTTCVLLGDAEMAEFVGGEALAADEASGALISVAQEGLAGLPCRAVAPVPPDAAAVEPEPDAAAAPGPDAASPRDAREAAQDSARANDAAPARSDAAAGRDAAGEPAVADGDPGADAAAARDVSAPPSVDGEAPSPADAHAENDPASRRATGSDAGGCSAAGAAPGAVPRSLALFGVLVAGLFAHSATRRVSRPAGGQGHAPTRA